MRPPPSLSPSITLTHSLHHPPHQLPPQVICSAKQSALASSSGWCYAPGCSATGQSGSGNNWALGHNKFGPAMAATVLELVRKQVCAGSSGLSSHAISACWVSVTATAGQTAAVLCRLGWLLHVCFDAKPNDVILSPKPVLNLDWRLPQSLKTHGGHLMPLLSFFSNTG
jgi:hypothetical protein